MKILAEGTTAGSISESVSQLTDLVFVLYSQVRGVVVPRPCMAMTLNSIKYHRYLLECATYSTDVSSLAPSGGCTLSRRPSGMFEGSYLVSIRTDVDLTGLGTFAHIHHAFSSQIQFLAEGSRSWAPTL